MTFKNEWVEELWQYRELFFFFIWRDIKIRYKQTVLGALWAVIQPLFTMVVFSLFFGGLAKMPSDGVPYPIFSYCALVPVDVLFRSACAIGKLSGRKFKPSYEGVLSKVGYSCCIGFEWSG